VQIAVAEDLLPVRQRCGSQLVPQAPQPSAGGRGELALSAEPVHHQARVDGVMLTEGPQPGRDGGLRRLVQPDQLGADGRPDGGRAVARFQRVARQQVANDHRDRPAGQLLDRLTSGALNPSRRTAWHTSACSRQTRTDSSSSWGTLTTTSASTGTTVLVAPNHRRCTGAASP
jgi:hypothetical protein